MSKQSEKSRHIGGKPDTKDEAENRKSVKGPTVEQKPAPKPTNPDVGDVKRDR